jgi:hypothetical protein
MANWGGIIAGALGGVAGAAQGMAQGAIEDERRLTIAQQLSDMEEQRQQRIAEASELRRRAGRGADIQQDISTAPMVAEAEAGKKRIIGPVETEQAAKREGAVVSAREGAEREAARALGEDKRALAGMRAGAQAKAVFSPGAYAEADLARMKTEDLKRHRALIDQYGAIQADKSLTDEQRQAALDAKQKQIELNIQRASGGKPAGDEDTTKKVKVKYTIDPLTGEKTGEEREESTEKRKRGPGAPAAKGAPKPSQAEAHAQAQAALARGAPLTAINARLKEQGYPPYNPRRSGGSVTEE